MQALQTYLIETQSLRFNVGLDLSEYDRKGRYEYNLLRLQREALKDILILPLDQLNNQLARIDMINASFEKAWKLWMTWNPNEITFQQIDAMRSFFISDLIPKGTVPKGFFTYFENALSLKNDGLLSFKAQVDQAVLSKKKINKPREKYRLVTGRHCVLFLNRYSGPYTRHKFDEKLKGAYPNFGTRRNLLDEFQKYHQKAFLSFKEMEGWNKALDELSDPDFERLVKSKLAR